MERTAGDTHFMKIGDLARMAGVTPRALRYYEELDLLQATRTTECGTRLYSPEALESLENILNLKSIGFSLSEIQQMSDWVRRAELDDTKRSVVVDQIERKLRKLDEDSERLREIKAQLLSPSLA